MIGYSSLRLLGSMVGIVLVRVGLRKEEIRKYARGQGMGKKALDKGNLACLIKI
jgi:hypothetical protein